MNKKINFKNSAFTLTELIIITMVIGILATILIVGSGGVAARARDSQRSSNIKSIVESLEKYYETNGEYPSCQTMTNSDLGALSKTLYGLTAKAFTMPKYTSNTNAILCTDNIDANANDIIAYNADTSSSCQTGSSCSYFTLQYREEVTGGVVSIRSKRGQILPEISNLPAANITSNSADLSAKIIETHNTDITDAGICWGTSPRPTTNCVSYGIGELKSMGTIAAGTYTKDIVVSPDGKSVYAINRSSDNLSMYRRDISTGVLTALSPATISTGDQPEDMVISPDGASVYVTNSGSGNISMYSRNAVSGMLTGPNSLNTNTLMPMGIAISPDGTSVYTGNNSTQMYIRTYSRNTSSGSLMIVNGVDIVINGSKHIIVSQDGKSAYASIGGVSTNSLIEISRNVSNGVLTYFASVGHNTCTGALAMSPDGLSVYKVSCGGILMYSRDIASGVLTNIGELIMDQAGLLQNLVISPDGGSVYATDSAYHVIRMYSRDALTGIITKQNIPTISSGAAFGIAISPDGNSVYVANASMNYVSTYSRNGKLSVNSSFVQSRTGIPSKTKIYYRSYATNKYGTTYSADSVFTTL